jgi:hypothetical protein
VTTAGWNAGRSVPGMPIGHRSHSPGGRRVNAGGNAQDNGRAEPADLGAQRRLSKDEQRPKWRPPTPGWTSSGRS